MSLLPGIVSLCGWTASILNGTECYCDEEGASALQRMIADYSPQGIHFIDSGNYHYVTKFWTDKLATPFALLVFDHHPDMQPPLFEHILSCGSWVKDVLIRMRIVRR